MQPECTDACKFAGMSVAETARWIESTLSKQYEATEGAAIARELLLYQFQAEKKDWIRIQQATLTTAMRVLLEQQVSRLLNQEPLQYVLNEAWFCGFRFHVEKGVLIPRPETEELVEWVISNCRFPVEDLSILDVGTGSGCIAISLKRRIRSAHVWALENSSAALGIAKKNALSLGAPIQFIHQDLFNQKSWQQLPQLDFIVSNPPYVTPAEKKEMTPQVLEFEPAEALFTTTQEPLLYYRALAQLFLQKGKNNSQLFCEINPLYAGELSKEWKQMGLCSETKLDMQGKERMIRAWVA